MFRYCPRCASQKIRFELDKVFRCPDCGLTYYHNVAAATACIIRSDEGVLFLVRAKNPGKGKLDLPGGFVDPGEGAIDGIRREIIEEIGLDTAALATKTAPHECAFFASFPNTYVYKDISYNTCDLFFYLHAPELSLQDLNPDKAETERVRFIKPAEIDYNEIAFESVKKALKVYLEMFA